MSARLTIRPATREDIEAFSDMAGKPSIRAMVGEIDGRIVGMAGVALCHGRWLGFCDLTDAARPYKMAIARAAIRFLANARASGIKFIYADIDANEPGANRWLESLGFALDPKTQHLVRWRA